MITLLTFGYAPQALSQDSSRTRTTAVDQEDDEDAPQQQTAKKHAGSHVVEASIVDGVEGGINMAALSFGNVLSGPKYGLTLGDFIDLRLSRKLYLQTGLYYLKNGASNVDYINTYSGQFVAWQYTWSINTYEIPVNILLKFGHPGRTRFFIGVGGYVAYNVNGSVSPNDVNNGVLNIGSDNTDDIKAWDFGIGFQGGFQLKDGIFFRLRYQGGLSNLRPNGTDASDISTASYGFQIGYLFVKKAKHVHRSAVDDDMEMKR